MAINHTIQLSITSTDYYTHRK